MCIIDFKTYLIVHAPIYIIGQTMLDVLIDFKLDQRPQDELKFMIIKYFLYNFFQAISIVAVNWLVFEKELQIFFQKEEQSRHASEFKQVLQTQSDFICIVDQSEGPSDQS